MAILIPRISEYTQKGKQMTSQETIALIEETLDLDEGVLAPDTVLADVEEYDSMAKLSLIVMAEDEFDKKFTSDIVKSFVTVNDILIALS
ncbi:acyl carrier protein [Adlercreutzia sp. ZJ138]|uniref:acyl carrier protein n=1 Tax=Adlercreutzia sp. ZJ138 TaxID=2709405 RepID=UPI00197E456E|nr:acyl carrier protein [Adlercreutzia sp. ZJ138]